MCPQQAFKIHSSTHSQLALGSAGCTWPQAKAPPLWRPLLLEQRAVEVKQQELRDRRGRTRRQRPWQALLNITQLQATLCCHVTCVNITARRGRALPGTVFRLIVRGCGELLRKVQAPLPGHHGAAHLLCVQECLQQLRFNAGVLAFYLTLHSDKPGEHIYQAGRQDFVRC